MSLCNFPSEEPIRLRAAATLVCIVTVAPPISQPSWSHFATHSSQWAVARWWRRLFSDEPELYAWSCQGGSSVLPSSIRACFSASHHFLLLRLVKKICQVSSILANITKPLIIFQRKEFVTIKTGLLFSPLAQFTGQSTANVIATNLGTYAWALWISAIIALFSVLCAIAVLILDKWLCARYEVTDQTDGQSLKHHTRRGIFSIKAIRHLPVSFW